MFKPSVSVCAPPLAMRGIEFVRPRLPVPPAVPPPVQLNQVSRVKSVAPRPGAAVLGSLPEVHPLVRPVELEGAVGETRGGRRRHEPVHPRGVTHRRAARPGGDRVGHGDARALVHAEATDQPRPGGELQVLVRGDLGRSAHHVPDPRLVHDALEDARREAPAPRCRSAWRRAPRAGSSGRRGRARARSPRAPRSHATPSR